MEKFSFSAADQNAAAGSDVLIGRPAPGTSSVITPEPGAYTQFLFKSNEINAAQLLDNGGLELKLTNGSTLVISNFKDLANSAQTCGRDTIFQFIKDTTDAAGNPLTKIVNVAPDALLHAMDPSAAQDGTIVIAAPPADKTVEVPIIPGGKYHFAFNMDDATRTVDGTNLIFSFKNGGLVILRDFVNVAAGELPPAMTLADGTVVNLTDLGVAACTPAEKPVLAAPAAVEAESASKIAPAAGMAAPKSAPKSIEAPMTEVAQALAGIEPAAGASAAAATGSRGGYGFASGIDPAGLAGLTPLGPLGPTSLSYGAPVASFGPLRGPTGPLSGPIPTVPTLIANDAIVYEDSSVRLDIRTTAPAGTTTTIVVTGIPSTWTVVDPGTGSYDPATGTWTVTVPAGGSFSGGPVIAPPHDSDGDILVLDVTSTATDTGTGTSTVLTGTMDVVTDAVADAPTLTATAAPGTEDIGADLTIATAATDSDGSEVISAIYISGVPTGFTLNHGTLLPDGRYLLTEADLTGLHIDGPANFSGTVTLTVRSESTEVRLTDREVDFTNNTAATEVPVTVTFGAVADAPTLATNNICIHEDGSLQLPITATLADRDGSEYLVVWVENIPAGWTVNPNGGTYDATTHIWSITLAPGTDFTGGPIFYPNANSDVDSGPLLVTAQSYETSTSAHADASATVTAYVDAVADAPTLTVVNTVNVRTGAPVPLTISGALNDLDGSETLSFHITGVPAGASLSAGASLPDGSWTLSASELVGLRFVPAPGFTGTVNLGVEAIATESNLSGVDCDPTNNVAITSAAIAVTIATNSVPVIVSAIVPMDETSSFPLTTTGTLSVDYGVDAASSVDPTGTFSSSGSRLGGVLSSHGVPVTVTLAGNTYTGTAGGATVFTLVVNTDGTYTYQQQAQIDHADPANPNDVISLVFGVRATDTDGDRTNGTITVNVADDAPVANDDPVLSSGGIVITGNVTTNDILGHDLATVVRSVAFGALTTIVPAAGNATIIGAHGTLVINALGAYTYTPVAGATGTDTFTYTLRDYDGDTDPAALTITVSDGLPVIGDASGTVDETNLGPIPLSGTLTHDFGTDGPGTIIPLGVGSFSSAGSRLGGALTAGGIPVVVSLVGDTYTGSAGAKTVFTLQVQADGTYTFTLLDNLDHANATDPNDIITLNFGVQIRDAMGSTDTGTIRINVLDDAPIAHPDDVTTLTGTAITGNVLTNDISTESPRVTAVNCGGGDIPVTPGLELSLITTKGRLDISSDGHFTYTPTGAPAYDLITCFNPVSTDVAAAGVPTLSKNGVTITAIDPTNGHTLTDLTWVEDSFWWGEKGIGIAGHADNYANGTHEGFRINLDVPADRVTVTVGGFDLFDQAAIDLVARVYTEAGGATPQTVRLVNGVFTGPVGIVSYPLDYKDFGGSKITRVDVYADDPGGKHNWTLLNVGTEKWSAAGGTDSFTYIVTDADGDHTTSTLAIHQVASLPAPAAPLAALSSVVELSDPVTDAIASFVTDTAAPTPVTGATASAVDVAAAFVGASVADPMDPLHTAAIAA